MKYRTLICHCVSYLRYLYKFCEETHCSFIFLFRLLSFGQDSGAFFEILEYSKTEAREALAGWWRRHVTLSVVLIGFQNNERDLFMLWGELRVTANWFWLVSANLNFRTVLFTKQQKPYFAFSSTIQRQKLPWFRAKWKTQKKLGEFSGRVSGLFCQSNFSIKVRQISSNESVSICFIRRIILPQKIRQRKVWLCKSQFVAIWRIILVKRKCVSGNHNFSVDYFAMKKISSN